ncbi:MAG: ThiF family adenylyltransferase [Candidatus Cryptobacteroides sp.]
MESLFERSELLLGSQAMERLRSARIILFGVGGVGSWCAEGLVRNGVEKLCIVDFDVVNPSNVNRQLEATSMTIGLSKVECMKRRLLEINPEAQIEAVEARFSAETAEKFELARYDVIIDAIDSLKDKIALLLAASRTEAKVFSSMGAALKMDPCRVRVAEFWQVRGCPLGAMLRKRMRQAGTLPQKEILCVYDDEVLENKGAVEEGTRVNGSLVHITAIFGMTLCGLVIKALLAE